MIPSNFVIDTLLGQGLHLLAGASKVGKSWMALWFSVCVAKGEEVWGLPSKQGDVLYLCLEDNRARIQRRLFYITDDAPPTVHFANAAELIGRGLEEQVECFLAEHPQTVLIIIDTIQMVRSTARENTYANDYKDLTVLKTLADQYEICILLIHHLRKETDNDVFNRISGTTGMQGAVDSSFTLVETERGSRRAMLNCIGRDIEHRKLELQMNDDNVWELLSDSLHEENRGKNRLALAVLQLMQDENELIMTPSELAERLNVTGLCSDDVLTNRVVTRRLMEIQLSLSSLGIGFRNYLSNGKRLVKVWRQSDDGDDTAGYTSPHPNTVAFVTADTSSNLTPAFPL